MGRKLRIERNKTRREVRVRLKVQKQQRRQEKSERKQAKIEREKLYAEIVKKGETEKKKRKADRKSRKQERKERRLARKHKRQMQKKKRQAKIPSLSSSSDDEQIKGKNQSIKNKLVEKMMEATNMEQQQSIPKKPATTNKREEKNTDETISVSWKVKGGTIRPKSPFDPDEDAEALHKAIKGAGTNVEVIIGIITSRTKSQRTQICVRYKLKYQKDLLKELEAEVALSGN